MDYVFGLMTPKSNTVVCGIWDELRFVKNAATGIMNEIAEQLIMQLQMSEAMEIIKKAINIEENITEEFFKRMEENEDIISWQSTEHFVFAFMSMKGFKELATEEEPTVSIRVGADHRKCTDDECLHLPTAEMLKDGWVPWEN